MRYGALRASGGTLQVTVQLKRLCEQRCIVLHFHPRPNARNVKEAGMLYLGAATGTFHGMHIAPEARGHGAMKRFFAYYVAFCRGCNLPARDTTINKKPAFAKLFDALGYTPYEP